MVNRVRLWRGSRGLASESYWETIDMYMSYDSALEMCGLQTLQSRREKRCLDFALKSIKHPQNKKMFPLNTRTNGHTFTTKESFIVNWARTQKFKDSTIPHCQ